MTLTDPSQRLAGRRVLITGASSGIGRASARRFVQEGARVALLARREALLEEVAAECGEAHTEVVPADVSDPAQATEGVARAVETMAGLDAVINAAGIAQPALITETSDSSWREMLEINLSGTFFVCRAAVPALRADGGGTIVNLGSELSFVGLGMCASYCAAKFGVLGLTKALAAELAPEITVNAVCPGPVDTPLLAGELELFPNPDRALQETIDRVPLKRLAQPDEVAAAIAYLVGEAGFATGSALMLDGGVTAI